MKKKHNRQIVLLLQNINGEYESRTHWGLLMK